MKEVAIGYALAWLITKISGTRLRSVGFLGLFLMATLFYGLGYLALDVVFN